MIILRSLDPISISRFTIRLLGDPASSAHGQADDGIAPSMREERTLLDSILVNSHLCTGWLDGSVRVNSNRLKRGC